MLYGSILPYLEFLIMIINWNRPDGDNNGSIFDENNLNIDLVICSKNSAYIHW